MKLKNLFFLLVVFILLIALSQLAERKTAIRKGPPADTAILNFDVNSIERITLASASQHVALAKSPEGAWVVENLKNYPANFDQLAGELRKLADLKGEPRAANAALAEDFGFDPTNSDDLNIKFEAAGGKPLGSIEVGKSRISESRGFPDASYVRTGGGQTFLVNQFLGGIPRSPDEWANRKLLEIPPAELAYIMVHRAGDEPYGILADTNGLWSISDLAPNEGPKQYVIDDVSTGLAHLEFSRLADHPLEGAISTFVGRTTNGLEYTVQLAEPNEAAGGRPAVITVRYEGGDTNLAARAAAENAKFSPWIYALTDINAMNLTRPRSELVVAPTNAPATAPDAAKEK